VGDASSLKLAKTTMAKSAMDAGWGKLKTIPGRCSIYDRSPDMLTIRFFRTHAEFYPERP
jgi:hypothetical protein